MSTPTNEQRAKWAQHCIDLFAKETRLRNADGSNKEDDETVLSDLLCDLRHWAARVGVDFDRICLGSEGVFEEEVAEENEDEITPEQNEEKSADELLVELVEGAVKSVRDGGFMGTDREAYDLAIDILTDQTLKQRGEVSQSDKVTKPEPETFEGYNLDVTAEGARALHRIVRSMHDGHCPKCTHIGPAEEFYHRRPISRRRGGPVVMHPDKDYTRHMCPKCEFQITAAEEEAALLAFSPYLQKSVQYFETWRANRKDLP